MQGAQFGNENLPNNIPTDFITVRQKGSLIKDLDCHVKKVGGVIWLTMGSMSVF